MTPAYRRAIAARRAFRWGDYPTLADIGLDGDYVSPIQLTSGALDGPMLISKDWSDRDTAVAHLRRIRTLGYLPEIPFNRVLDRALALIGLRRDQIYISPVFQLLTPRRSSTIPAAAARASFDAVVRHEVMGRRPVALGEDAARVLRHFGVPHVATIHPSARGQSFDARAARIAAAIRAAL